MQINGKMSFQLQLFIKHITNRTIYLWLFIY